jgi:hypothetical protein
MIASPRNVVSVSVGEVGDWASFSSTQFSVSPVHVRAGIVPVRLIEKCVLEEQVRMSRKWRTERSCRTELWLTELWRVNVSMYVAKSHCTHVFAIALL